MSLQIIGLNHKTAPLEVRERLAFKEQNLVSDLRHLTDGASVGEALILSTCNRVEIVVQGDEDAAVERTIEFLASSKGIAPDVFAAHLYHLSGERAVHHLFRVAASLDSMIVGEAQILGQVRRAYSLALEAGTARRSLHKLLHHTFHVAKRVRTETCVGSSAVSLSYAAIEKAVKMFGTLADKTVLLVGAGEMTACAAKHLVKKRARRILICNRTPDNAFGLVAETGGEFVRLENLENALAAADIVICSTSAPDFLITEDMVEKSQRVRGFAPTLFVDISVPRNVAPRIGTIENVFAFDVDDLQSVIAANLDERQREAMRAEEIVSEEVQKFRESLRALDKGETLGLLRQTMRDSALNELERFRAKLADLTPAQQAAVEQLLLATVNKIAHPILYGLRRSHEAGAVEFAEILSTMLSENRK